MLLSEASQSLRAARPLSRHRRSRTAVRTVRSSRGSLIGDQESYAPVLSRDAGRGLESEQAIAAAAVGRRMAIAGIAACAGMVTSPVGPAFAEAAAAALTGVDADLEKRLMTASFGWPGPFSGPYVPQLFFPNWLFGEWAAESTLVNFELPKGARVAPREAAAGAKIDRSRVVAFTQRFYSTLPDSFANTLRVTLGAVPQQKTIADRAFNRMSYTNAVLGAEVVRRVDLLDDGQETVLFRGGQAKSEIYVSNIRQTDLSAGGDEGGLGLTEFRTAECFRQVRVGTEQVDVRDYEVVNRYSRTDADTVSVRQRVSVFLNPQDAEYFSAPGQPVAFYDFAVQMRRRRGLPPAAELAAIDAAEQAAANGGGGGGGGDGGGGAAAASLADAEAAVADPAAAGLVCVLTPKSVVQCVDG